MKDSLFEMLLNLFEKTLTQLKEKHLAASGDDGVAPTDAETTPLNNEQLDVVKFANETSMRIFTPDEQRRFTKASYQFLVRMMAWGVISAEDQEVIINRLIFSDSRFVTLQEAKWAIRNVLSNQMNSEQIAFLDLVLYQKEDGLSLH